MARPEGEGRQFEPTPQQREIDKQLARARRLDYRKQFQTEPRYIPPEQTPEEESLAEAEHIIWSRQSMESREKERQALERLTPEERERHDIERSINRLKQRPILSYRITLARFYRREYLDKLQQHDPEFMNPIITGIEKRPARQAKAERAIEQRGINPGVDEYGEYDPLWERG
jgi:hypothetical protein